MSFYATPKFHPVGLDNIRTYLTKQRLLRSLDHPERIPVIKSKCPSLDWITNCGGIPRGRVVVVKGPESSGKCVCLSTFVPVYGRGLVRMQDLANELSWHTSENEEEVLPDQHAELIVYVPNAESNPVQTNAMYFAGTLESHRVTTEDGNELIGAKTHRILSLTDRGILSWIMLRDLRLGDVLVKTIGQMVAGTSSKIFQWLLPVDDEEVTLQKTSTASFFGAMCGVETRDRSLYLLVTNPRQIQMVRQWAREMTEDDSADPFDKDVAEFSRFSGMARIRDGRWSELVLEAIKTAPGIIRTASITAQSHWCAGMTLTRGVWTQNDLEIELESEEVAKTLHMVLENIGVRSIIYPSLDTFSRAKFKVALRDRLAQQMAQQTLWSGYDFSSDWKGESVIDQVETHEYLRKTLERAQEALREEGLVDQAESIDVEDLEKDNLKAVAELIFPLSLRKKTFDRIYQTLFLMASPCTCLDRVTFSKATGVEVPMADFSVPIGSLYSTGGLISHNSTLAMHIANQELTDNPNAVVAFQDYEHSMAVNYARQMGLHKHQGRFLLIPSDEFEMADNLVKIFEQQKVFPSLWIIDSVPAMVPKAAFERESDENPQVALQARMFSDLLARWVKFAAKYGVTFLLLNQLRSNIQIGWGQRGKKTVGIAGSDKENQPGGFALRFYCIPGKTRLLTSDGLLPIQSLPSVEKHDGTIKLGTEWGEGGFQGVVQTETKSLWRVSTHNKREFYASKDHQWKVLTNDCRVTFKRTEEIITGEDYILSVVGDCGLLPEDRGLSEDVWFAVGATYGDGNITQKRQMFVTSPVWENEVSQRCSKAVREVGGAGNIISQVTGEYGLDEKRAGIFDNTEMLLVHTTNSTITGLFPEYGVQGSWRKHGVPELLWTQGKRQMAAFIRGWYSTDGGCHFSKTNRSVSAFSKYRQVVQDVQEILLVLGMKSRPSRSIASGSFGIRRGYQLFIQGSESRRRFGEIIGFEVQEKQDILDQILSLQETSREVFGIPYATQLIRRIFPRRGQGGGYNSPPEKAIRALRLGKNASLLADSMVHNVLEIAEVCGDSPEDIQFLRDYICNDWWFDKVERVQETHRTALCYDVAGSETETYLINGAVTHNSSMTLDLRPSKVIKASVYNPMLGEREDIPIANMVKMTVSKNKCGSPYRSAMAYIQFGEGIDTARTILDLSIAQRLVAAKGKGTYEVRLPSGQLLSVTGKEKFVQALKGQHPMGHEALSSLMKMLQWDKADEVHSQVLGMTEEIVDTGEEEELSDSTGVASEGLLELVLSRDSLIEQADVLNLLTRRSKTIYWTNPATGIEYRGQRLELLESKLGDEGYAALEKIVLDEIHKIETNLSEQEAKALSLQQGPSGEAAQEVTEVVTGSLEGLEAEVPGNGIPEELEVPEGSDGESGDLISTLLNGDDGDGDDSPPGGEIPE